MFERKPSACLSVCMSMKTRINRKMIRRVEQQQLGVIETEEDCRKHIKCLTAFLILLWEFRSRYEEFRPCK
jgi:hypothetical protein